MKLATAPEKARAIGPGQHKAAASLYNDIEQELEHGGYSEEDSEAADEALAHLEANHPGVRQAAHQITRPPNLSRRAKQGLDEPRNPVQAGPKQRRPATGMRQRAARATMIHATRRRGGRGFSPGAAFGQIPGSGTVSQLLMRTLGGMAGISLLYLLLTPKGSGALSTASNGVTDVLRVLASPTKDPLRPKATGAGARAPMVPPPQMFDTPHGPAPFKPPTFGHPPGGVFNTPGGTAPFKPPTKIKVAK